MSDREYTLADQVMDAPLMLAMEVKRRLELEGGLPTESRSWGHYSIGRIELVWSDAHDVQVVGALVPDDAHGTTLDLWTVHY